MKIFVAFLLLVYDRRQGFGEAFVYLHKSTFSHPSEVLKLLVPSSLYVLQNNLVLVAAVREREREIEIFFAAIIF
jgi:hypothetical protein